MRHLQTMENHRGILVQNQRAELRVNLPDTTDFRRSSARGVENPRDFALRSGVHWKTAERGFARAVA